jgi:hypothetical protein
VRSLGRLLWLLLGVLWRLVVLLLFEKWVPLPERSRPEQRAPATAQAARGKKKGARDQTQHSGAPALPARSERAVQPSPFFAAKSSELSPELAAQREGEHWLKPRRSPAPVRARAAPRESLAGLLRSRRALREAVVLDAALGQRERKA